MPIYTNPVLDGYADPDVLYYEGTYYMYATSTFVDTGYEVYTSQDLVHWVNKGKCLDKAWGISKSYWAPDVKEYNGRFYMLISADEHLGMAIAESPMGPFIPYNAYFFEKTIDGHIFFDEDGSMYIYYASWRDGKKYALYGLKMDEFKQPIYETEQLLIIAEEQWECYQDAVQEAPYMLKHNGLYYLTYSASHFESIYYAVGYAVSESPLGVFRKSEKNPILVGGKGGLNGTAHHCIICSPNGKEMFIVYHCHHDNQTVVPRSICIDRIWFEKKENESDILVVNGPTNTPQQYPLSDNSTKIE